MEVSKKEISMYGCIEPESFEEDLVRILSIIEKPSPEEAPSNLAVIGRYVLTPEIFDALRRTTPGRGGEIQLTDAINLLAQEQAVYAYRFDGRRFDVGNPLDYLKATVELGAERDDPGPGVPRVARSVRAAREAHLIHVPVPSMPSGCLGRLPAWPSGMRTITTQRRAWSPSTKRAAGPFADRDAPAAAAAADRCLRVRGGRGHLLGGGSSGVRLLGDGRLRAPRLGRHRGVGVQPGELKVVGHAMIGQRPEATVGMGEAVAIATGAPIPAGADAVVAIENAETRDGDLVRVFDAVEDGRTSVLAARTCARARSSSRTGSG
jgi:hypothetical protein